MEGFLGFSQEHFIGKNILEILPLFGKDGKKVLANKNPVTQTMRTNIRTSIASTDKMFYRKKDGTLLPISLTVSPILVDGIAVGIVGVFRDATEERDIDKAKSEFVSLASHQLKTPLTAINWYTEMLLEDEKKTLSKDQGSYVSEIHDASVRMSNLVNSLLNVSRLELGTFAIDPEMVNIQKVIDGVLKDQNQAFKAKKQKFTLSIDSKIPEVSIDTKLAHIIIQNLLSNASKYSPEESLITLDIKKDTKDIIITCTDNGFGIPRNQQDKIFQKLFRADNIQTMDVEGTGLGLYIIKTIADTSGCDISFVSEEGVGSTFVLRIPLSGMKGKKGVKKITQTP